MTQPLYSTCYFCHRRFEQKTIGVVKEVKTGFILPCCDECFDECFFDRCDRLVSYSVSVEDYCNE